MELILLRFGFDLGKALGVLAGKTTNDIMTNVNVKCGPAVNTMGPRLGSPGLKSVCGQFGNEFIYISPGLPVLNYKIEDYVLNQYVRKAYMTLKFHTNMIQIVFHSFKYV